MLRESREVRLQAHDSRVGAGSVVYEVGLGTVTMCKVDIPSSRCRRTRWNRDRLSVRGG